jgi:ABC-type molybdate transport system substrate-binding protein
MARSVKSIRTRALTVSLLVPLLCAFTLAQAKPEQVAQTSAESWLALTDSGKYAESWDTAAQLFKSAVTKDQWQAMLHAARDPLGKVLSRTLKSASYTKTLPGAPDGQYVVIQYETRFEHKQSAVETITPMLDKDGEWRVSGYYIK